MGTTAFWFAEERGYFRDQRSMQKGPEHERFLSTLLEPSIRYTGLPALFLELSAFLESSKMSEVYRLITTVTNDLYRSAAVQSWTLNISPRSVQLLAVLHCGMQRQPSKQ